MVPAQVIIALDQENKPEIATKVLAAQDDKSLMCTSNCEDTAFDMEPLPDQQPMATGATEGAEVNITECTKNNDIRLSEADDPDATEYSSSFGDTISGTEDCSRLSDAEVDSRCCGDNGMCSTVSDGLDSLFWIRKKKLTAHWKRYIRPLMWRCKWIELRIKEFQSQALKYDRELETYDQSKQFELGRYTSEGCAARSLPFSRQSHRKKAMQRRKRKRVEDMVDISSYMSSHNLFSYYEHKRSGVDGASADDDCNRVTAEDINNDEEFVVHCEWPPFEFRDGDNSLEQVLQKIETVQCRVRKLKSQMDKLLTDNAGKFSSRENLSLFVPSDLPSSSARSPTSSPGNGDPIPIEALNASPQHLQEYGIRDLVMPGSEVLGYGEVAPLSDIIESMMMQLSAAEVYLDQPQIENTVDDVLIHNQAADKELHNFERVGSLPIEKPQEPVKEQQKNIVTKELHNFERVRSLPIEKPQEPVKEQEKNIVTKELHNFERVGSLPIEKPQEPVKEQEKNIVTPSIPTPDLDPAEETIVTQEPVLKDCLTPKCHVPKNKRKRVERRAGSGAWNAEKISLWRSSR